MVELVAAKGYPGLYRDVYAKGRPALFTKCPGAKKAVYGERLFMQDGDTYRAWDPNKSKLGAGLAKGIKLLGFGEGDVILYLGAATGTTVSHVSDIAGSKGMVFALDIAPQTTRPLVFLAQDRSNIAPILADAAQPMTYVHRVCLVDFVFQDVAQRLQVDLFLRNLLFLRKGGYAMLALKCRSVDVARQPKDIYHDVRGQLEQHVQLIDAITLDPFEKDHYLFLVRKM